MRALFAGVVVLAMGTGACALIAGLGDYEGAGGSDSSVSRLVKDSGAVVGATDDSNDPPLNGEAAASEETPDSNLGGDSPFVVGSDDAGLSDAMLSADVGHGLWHDDVPCCCTATASARRRPVRRHLRRRWRVVQGLHEHGRRVHQRRRARPRSRTWDPRRRAPSRSARRASRSTSRPVARPTRPADARRTSPETANATGAGPRHSPQAF